MERMPDIEQGDVSVMGGNETPGIILGYSVLHVS
jgi:hypothetical protein